MVEEVGFMDEVGQSTTMKLKIATTARPMSRLGSRAVLTTVKRDFRGRDASYLAPPAQIRTGPIRAYGSHLGCLTANLPYALQRL